MYKLYKFLTEMVGLMLPLYLKDRANKGKEDPERLWERFGEASVVRPEGKLIWLHGASVGEVLSLQVLIEKITEIFPEISILVTSGTVTSAKLMGKKLPENAFHQYVPLDTVEAVDNFFNHWKPDLVLWAESELWPNMLMEMQKRNIPAALINGRMSKKSAKRWRRMYKFSTQILSSFQTCLVQNENEAEHFLSIGAKNVKAVGNLKYASKPLDFCEVELFKLKETIKKRPACLFASTHAGEDEIFIGIHNRLKHSLPEHLTVIAPRHPERANEIIEICRQNNLKYSLRSKGGMPAQDDDVYIVDTMGDLGLFFKAMSLVVIGGSFVPHGGHNPIEPARLECQILYGPHMHNFLTICDDFLDASAGRMIPNEDALFEEMHHLYLNPVEGKVLSEKALILSESKSNVINDIMTELYPVFQVAKLS